MYKDFILFMIPSNNMYNYTDTHTHLYLYILYIHSTCAIVIPSIGIYMILYSRTVSEFVTMSFIINSRHVNNN